MDIRVAALTPVAGAGLPLPGAGAAAGGGGDAHGYGVSGPGPGPGPAPGSPSGPAAGIPPGPTLGGAQAILAGLVSPLVDAGFLPAAAPGEIAATLHDHVAQAQAQPAAWAAAGAPLMAGTAALGLPAIGPGRGDAATTATPLAGADAGASTQSGGGHNGAAEPAAALPLMPAWVTALHTPASQLHPWPQAERERRPGRDRPGPDTSGEEPQTESPPAGGDPARDAGNATGRTEERAALAPWPPALDALLPPPVRAELARRRSVLLVAPPGAAQRGLQLACLGFDSRGRPVCHRWAARGAAGAAAGGAAAHPEWRFWRVRREGDDGQRPVLHARPLAASPAAAGLVLRATATLLPPPLRAAHDGWLDVLEPQRLWRDLGSQWTLLLAWSPHALPLNGE